MNSSSNASERLASNGQGDAEPSAKMSLELGCLMKPIADQLAAQGLPFDAHCIEHLSRDAEAVSRLRVRGVIGWSAGVKLYDKIAKSVWREVRREMLKGAKP